MFYFVRTFKDFSKVKEKKKKTQKLACHKIKLQVTPNAKKVLKKRRGSQLPPRSSLFCLLLSLQTHEEQAGLHRQVRKPLRGPTGSPARWQRAPAPPKRKLRGLFVRAGNLDSPIAVPACVTPSGLRGASCQVPFQEWCHFHQGLTVAPGQRSGTERAGQRTRPEWGHSTQAPWGTKLFSPSGGEGALLPQVKQTQPRKGFKTIPLGPMSLPGAQGSWGSCTCPSLKWKLFCWKQKQLPSPRPNRFIASKCLPVLRKYAIEQEMKKYPFLPKGRGRNHIPIETGNQLTRIPAMSGKWLSPSSTQELWKPSSSQASVTTERTSKPGLFS